VLSISRRKPTAGKNATSAANHHTARDVHAAGKLERPSPDDKHLSGSGGVNSIDVSTSHLPYVSPPKVEVGQPSNPACATWCTYRMHCLDSTAEENEAEDYSGSGDSAPTPLLAYQQEA
jgi:hypothetical protein